MQLRVDDELELHVQELGAGPPVVMLHGLLLGNMSTWYWTAAPELARTHHVVLYDLRGHGRSSRPARGYDVERMSRDLEEVIAGREEPVDLVGHSYGALVALRFALRHPGRVRRLALVEAPLPPSRFAELDDYLRAGPDQLLDALPEALRDVVGAKGRQARRFIAGVRALAQETSLIEDLRREGDVDDGALGELRCPLLAVYGTHSSCRSVGARLSRLAPRARLVELEGGHFLPLEAPAALTATLKEFLDA